ncbi:DMT family transporter [Janthinobacterium sp. 1_2014MBL_MicDiv]|uniref:DMT family transporter n=1 Tax=Janthinobacterium sp. 1_2014MBL_MicDiv TaxID=1644131 RepID=UPI0008F4B0D2|nr:DMT family transporter [Janthinobacterium sp. 1_2014MBL_MicDiv]APA69290.1 multidrug DMT transporter permease [Janthinobacterium sp. 1_2014MBL_MicDiv]
MPSNSTAAASPPTRLSADHKGLLLGLIAVALFSLTLPFTRMAVAELDPTFVALGRALVAACLAGLWLWHQRAPLPRREQWLPLALVSLGCVLGFPWLTSIAMRSLPASHGAVLVGILPLATAVFAVLRGKERPSPGFWLMAVAGTALVVAFALRQGGGSFHLADVLMFAAVVLGALGYAEGGRLAQSMPGQHVISWALLLAVPFVLPVVLWNAWPQRALMAQASTAAWLSFAYISVFSMFIGFFFWYRGMALGGVARVGQTQLLQPFLTLLGAAVLLGEPLTGASLLFAGAVIAVVAAGRKLK